MRRLLVYITFLAMLGIGMQSARAEVLVRPSIVGGVEATANEFPFMAYIHYAGGFSAHRCGGALISTTWVLTAGHCVVNYSASSFRVGFGVHNKSSAGLNPYLQDIAVQKIVMLPSLYNATTYDYDIALIELASPVTVNEHVAVAALGDLPGAAALYADGAPLSVIGWGYTAEGGPTSSVLRKVTVPVVSNEHCDDVYGLDPAYAITTRMLCAGDYDNGGIDACQGDSGGPLFGTVDGAFTVVGIVSSGEGCARPTYPGIYTRVSAFSGWIAATMRGEAMTPTVEPVTTVTPSVTRTATVPKPSATPSVTRSKTRTATPFRTATKSRTRTRTPRFTATRTRTATPSKTRTRTRTRTPGILPTATAIPSVVSP